jgi:O-antigen/teichoic acid export membrane protein
VNLRQRAFKGVIWSSALSLGTQASSFILSFALARILGKAVFGEWGIIQNTVISIAGIAQLSMAVTATKYVAEHRDSNPGRVGSILGLCSFVTTATGVVATLALLLFADPIARDTLHAPQLALTLRIASAHLLFLTVNGFQIGALSGFELFRPLAVIGVVYGLGSSLVVFVLAHRYGLNGAVIGLSSATFLNWLAHHGVLTRFCRRRGIRVSYRNLRSEMQVLTSFTVPATLSGVAGSAGVWLSNVILVRQAHGYEQMAVLAAAGSFKSVILFMPNVVTRVSMPLLVNLFGEENQERYKNAFAKSLWVITGSALAVAIPIAIGAPWLLLAFGKSFQDGAAVVAILAIATVFEVASLGLYQQIFSAGWMWSGFSIAAARALILAVGTSFAAPSLGAKGAAYAALGSQIFGLALTFWILRPKRAEISHLSL